MAFSAFDDKAHEPQPHELAATLGSSLDLWQELVSAVGASHDPIESDWVFSGKAWGWALRLKRKRRAVLYLTPADCFFHVGLALGEKAVAAAHRSDLPSRMLEVIDQSRKYAEGRAVRFAVRRPEDVAAALRLAAIKMAN